jgi:FMN phosphatase YigB (HAD superfamily)
VVVTSQSCGFAKPDPRILQVALAALALEPRHAVYVGDDPATDGAAARAAGIRFVLVQGEAATGDAGWPRGERVATLRELASLLL